MMATPAGSLVSTEKRQYYEREGEMILTMLAYKQVWGREKLAEVVVVDEERRTCAKSNYMWRELMSAQPLREILTLSMLPHYGLNY